VGHVRHWGLGDPDLYTQNQIYISFNQLPDESVPLFRGDIRLIVRTPLDIASLLPAIKAAVYGAGDRQPVYNIRTMRDIASRSMTSERFTGFLLGAFACSALLLASVGIYGVISYAAARRVREIGIRMAVGAQRLDIFRMVIGQGVRLGLAGLAIGLVAASILARLVSGFSHLLYGVSASDPVTLAGSSLALIAVTVLACYIPGRRAAKVDPIVTLRYE
jgi:ABC-type antimicrobial peptide transport system permease subunit